MNPETTLNTPATPPPQVEAPKVEVTPPPVPGVEKPSTFLERATGRVESKPTGSKLLASLAQKQSRSRLVELPPAPPDKPDAPKEEVPPVDPKKVETPPTPPVPTAPAPAPAPKKKSRDSEAMERAAKTVDRLANTVEKLVSRSAEPAPVNAPPEITLTPKQQSAVEAMRELEELYPKQYERGFADKVMAMIPKVAEYEKQYREKHPNASDDDIEEAIFKFEHDHGLEVDPKHMEEARISAANRPLREEVAALKEDLKRLVGSETARKVEPMIQRTATRGVQEAAAVFGKEYSDLINGSGDVDETLANAFIEKSSDPVMAEIGVAALRDTRDFAQAIVAVRLNQPHPLSGNALKFISSVEERYIERIGRHDEAGRELVRESQLTRMPAAEARKLVNDQHPTKFLIPEAEIVSVAADEIAEMAKQDAVTERERLKRMAARLGFKAEPAATTPTPAPAPKVGPKPTSPSNFDSVPTQVSNAAPQSGAGMGSWHQRLKTGQPKARFSLIGGK